LGNDGPSTGGNIPSRAASHPLDFDYRNTHISPMTSRPQQGLPKPPKPVSAHAREDRVSDADLAFLTGALTESIDAAKAGKALTPDERFFDRKRQRLRAIDKAQ
jgi:hypothetical protein